MMLVFIRNTVLAQMIRNIMVITRNQMAKEMDSEMETKVM